MSRTKELPYLSTVKPRSVYETNTSSTLIQTTDLIGIPQLTSLYLLQIFLKEIIEIQYLICDQVKKRGEQSNLCTFTQLIQI